jgi:hypothetical protein
MCLLILVKHKQILSFDRYNVHRNERVYAEWMNDSLLMQQTLNMQIWRLCDCASWKLSYNKTNWMHQFLKFISGMKHYMFRTVPLSIIRRFLLYTQQWYMSYRFADCLRAESVWVHPDPAWKLSANLYDIFHCGVYSKKRLMMDRGTVRNM